MLGKDGRPYRASGKLQMYNPTDPKHDLFNKWDRDAIMAGGTPVYYHEVIIQTNTVDPIYFEDRGKIYNPNPVEIWASYEPQPDMPYVTEFGFNGMADIILDCNYKDVLERIGHPPKPGSWIRTPHLDRDWILVNSTLGEFGHWGALRIKMVLKRFQDDIHTKRDTSVYKKADVTMQSFHNPNTN